MTSCCLKITCESKRTLSDVFFAVAVRQRGVLLAVARVFEVQQTLSVEDLVVNVRERLVDLVILK